jgi:hypothetical protein
MQGPISLPKYVSWRWLGIAGLLTVTVSATVHRGLLGLLAGAVLASSWHRLPPEYPFTLGQFAIVAVFADPSTLGSAIDVGHPLFIASELGLLALLVTPAEAAHSPNRGVIAATAGLPALAGLVSWWSVRWLDSIWIALVAAGGVAVLFTHGSHEYEYWALDTPQEHSYDDD